MIKDNGMYMCAHRIKWVAQGTGLCLLTLIIPLIHSKEDRHVNGNMVRWIPGRHPQDIRNGGVWFLHFGGVALVYSFSFAL